jgi:hypothetical protein
MQRSQPADGAYRLQIRKVATDTLKKITDSQQAVVLQLEEEGE